MKDLQAAHSAEIQAVKSEHTRHEDQLRSEGAERERDALSKLDAERSEGARLRADWLQEKEHMQKRFQQSLHEKELEFKRALEEVTKSADDGASRHEIESTRLRAELSTIQQALTRAESEGTRLKKQVEDKVNEAKSAGIECENKLREMQERMVPGSALDELQAECDQIRCRLKDTDQKLESKEQEVEKLQAQKESITTELNLASKMLLKRGEDFTETVSLLEVRLEENSRKSDELRQSLESEQSTTARLSTELKEANMLIAQYVPSFHFVSWHGFTRVHIHTHIQTQFYACMHVAFLHLSIY